MSATQPRKFAVFDIDGTLIRWQLYHAVTNELARQGLLGPDAYDMLHEARMHWKRREHDQAFSTYEQAVIELYENALQNIPPAQFDTTVEKVAQEYRSQVYTYTRDLAASLKQQGYVLLAISGSHQELVKHVAEQYAFDDWVGTQYERTAERFTGKKFIASHDKKTVLQKLIKKHNLTLDGSYAVGDSKSDAVMLEMVEHPIAFNPDQTLLAIAQKHGWRVVVERKNVTYELEERDGRYVLA